MDISAAIDILEELGPAAGRPLVDKLKHTNLHNLKELRPGSSGTSEIRILFAFDEIRQAVFLIAGDKEGNWEKWYDEAIPVAEDRFERHRREHLTKQAAEPETDQPRRRRKT